MDDINRSISQHVKSGKYYEDARLWYTNRFITPHSDRSYLFVLICFYSLVIAIASYYYSNTSPADPIVNYLVFPEDIAKTYSVISSPGNESNAPQERITKYVLEKYVKTRESYSLKEVANQLEFIKNTTVGTDYLNYENMMSINNPFSPLMIYQDLYQKIITVKKVDLIKLPQDNSVKGLPSHKSIVYFQSALKNISTNQMNYEDFVATIDFKTDNIEAIIKTKANQMTFLVMSYNLRKINKPS